MKKVIWPG